MKGNLVDLDSRCETVRKPTLPRWATGRGTAVLEGPRNSRRIETRAAA